MLAIGGELLSGRVKDNNIGHLAEMLMLSGIAAFAGPHFCHLK